MKAVQLYIAAIALIAIGLFLASCSDNTGPKNASFTTLNELKNSPGFEWFQPQYDAYQPDQAVISQIKTKLAGSTKQFVLFVNPSCACSGTQKQFPDAIKVLQESGIFEPNYKIYTFLTVEDMHPYMKNYKVRELPCLFTLQDSLITYSIIDSLNKYSLVDSTSRIEHYLLKALN